MAKGSDRAAPGSRNSMSRLLLLPAEVRLKIYDEILVKDFPIAVIANHEAESSDESEALTPPHLLPLVWVSAKGLSPALFRVNKQINREATSILYSNNEFRFADVYILQHKCSVPHVAPFIRQIGLNAGLLRHMCFNFPDWTVNHLNQGFIELIHLIKVACTGLRELEMLCSTILWVRALSWAEKLLREMDDCGLGDMPSLKKVIVIHGYVKHPEEVHNGSRELIKKMGSSPWHLKQRNVSSNIWIASAHDVIEFDIF